MPTTDGRRPKANDRFPGGNPRGPDQKHMSNFLDILRERVIIYDGAMGTQIQERNLSVKVVYWDNEGCSEILVLSRPDVVRDIHTDYFKAGADIVETNTFGATDIVLGEYDLQAK